MYNSNEQAKYKYLYKYLRVLDATQIGKLYKIVAGMLDVSTFTKDEIDRLENRILALQSPN